MWSRRSLIGLLPSALLAAGTRAEAGLPPPGAAVRELLGRQVDQSKLIPGIVVGSLDPNGGRRIQSYGRSGSADVPLDGDTVFDVGSLTKLLTALTLADMVVRGELAMSDPLQAFVPEGIRVPDFRDHAITLLDLVTYSPGLPEWPADMPPLSAGQPFPPYSTAALYQALSSTTLDAAPGEHFVYSDFGYGLLGLALARHARMDFESLVVSRVCTPLGMNSTRMTFTPALQRRVAPGHDAKLAPVARWDLPPAFAAAGAFRSTANDLLRFLAAAMGLARTPLMPAFAEMLKVQRSTDQPDTQVAAGWFVTHAHGNHLLWKDGGVAGYVSFLGYSTVHRNGIVLLMNGMTYLAPLGKHLLDEEFPATA